MRKKIPPTAKKTIENPEKVKPCIRIRKLISFQ